MRDSRGLRWWQPQVVVLRTTLEVPRILERLARWIPERPSVLMPVVGGLRSGAVHGESFTLDWWTGELEYRVVGTIRDRGDDRLIRMVVESRALGRWAVASAVASWIIAITLVQLGEFDMADAAMLGLGGCAVGLGLWLYRGRFVLRELATQISVLLNADAL